MIIKVWFSRGVIDFLRQGFETDKAETTCERKRLLISRQNAQWRRLLNESDLFQALKAFNFELLKLENNSIASQIEITSQAEIIISPIGAGNNLCIFAPANAIFVEPEPPNENAPISQFTRECCHRISQSFYKVTSYKATGVTSRLVDQTPFNADYEVDVSKMVEFLTSLNL